MELFVTDYKGKPTMTAIESIPVSEGDGLMQGFCEFCWQYDSILHLGVYHPYGSRSEHVMGHARCVETGDTEGSWAYCEC